MKHELSTVDSSPLPYNEKLGEQDYRNPFRVSAEKGRTSLATAESKSTGHDVEGEKVYRLTPLVTPFDMGAVYAAFGEPLTDPEVSAAREIEAAQNGRVRVYVEWLSDILRRGTAPKVVICNHLALRWLHTGKYGTHADNADGDIPLREAGKLYGVDYSELGKCVNGLAREFGERQHILYAPTHRRRRK